MTILFTKTNFFAVRLTIYQLFPWHSLANYYLSHHPIEVYADTH